MPKWNDVAPPWTKRTQHFLLTSGDEEVTIEPSGVILIRRRGDAFYPAIRTGDNTIECAMSFATEDEAMAAARDFLEAAGHGSAQIGPYTRVGEGLPN